MSSYNKIRNLQIISGTQSASAEISGDFILPDKYPDVKKLLRVRARPSIVSRYMQSGRLEIEGKVDYSVLFSAEGDKSEELHCVRFSENWRCDFSEIPDTDNVEISVTPHISALTSKTANPRKITLRATIVCDTKVCTIESCTPTCDGDFKKGCEPPTERLWENVITKRGRSFMAEPLQISETVESDIHQPQIDCIIDCDGSMRFYEVKPIKSGNHLTLSLKGEMVVDFLYKAMGDEAGYRSFSRKFPITSTIDGDEFAEFFDGCDEKTLEALAVADITEISAAVSENSYGERRCAEVNAVVDITVHLAALSEVPLCLDSYSVNCNTECTHKEFDCESAGKMISTNFSVGETLSRSDARIPENAVPVDQRVTLTEPSVAVERGRATFTCEALVSCIFAHDGGFSHGEFKLPIRFDTNVGNITEPVSCFCRVTPSDLRIGLSGERISFDFEVTMTSEIFTKEHRKIVDTVHILDNKLPDPNAPSITLCYPTHDDTLWQIAKRYNTTADAIRAQNGQSNRVLLIPNPKKHA